MFRPHSAKGWILLWCKSVSLPPPEKSVCVTALPLNSSQHLPKLERDSVVCIHF